jgi:hypothetical protein
MCGAESPECGERRGKVNKEEAGKMGKGSLRKEGETYMYLCVLICNS